MSPFTRNTVVNLAAGVAYQIYADAAESAATYANAAVMVLLYSGTSRLPQITNNTGEPNG